MRERFVHLGMSGSLRLLTQPPSPTKHDHIDIEFVTGNVLRFTDPRRFGAFLWTTENSSQHPLLKNLGVEPLTKNFSVDCLQQAAKSKTTAIKTLIMDHKTVVGIGNIYAAEALFLAGIHPAVPAKILTKEQFDYLVKAIKLILRAAIKQGGTTLKDFVSSDGKPGYFVNQLNVYGRAGLPCVQCASPLKALRINQRNTVYCERCQSGKK